MISIFSAPFVAADQAEPERARLFPRLIRITAGALLRRSIAETGATSPLFVSLASRPLANKSADERTTCIRESRR